MKITPYLNFNGETKKAFELYQKCFGGDIEAMIPFSETPHAEAFGADGKDLIMHASLKLPDGAYLLASDAPPGQYEKPAGVYVSVHVDNAADAKRIFDALSSGGTVEMPLEKTFWAEAFGMTADPFGIKWMVNCELPKS